MLAMKLRILPVLNRLDHDPRDEGGDDNIVAAREVGEGCARYHPGETEGFLLSFLLPGREK